jgi:hypothetical protein
VAATAAAKQCFFKPQSSFKDNSRIVHFWELDHLVSTYLDAATTIFLQRKFSALLPSLQPGGPALCIYIPK